MKTNKHWRVHNFINPTLRAWKRKEYLEIGGDGRVARMVKGNAEIVSPKEIPVSFGLYTYQMGIEDFFSLISEDRAEKYGVILLRDWDNENLENRVKACYEMLMSDGVLIVEGFDASGDSNESWRIAGGLKKEGIPTGVIKGSFLCVYKTESIEGKIRLGIKKSTFLKNPEKYLS